MTTVAERIRRIDALPRGDASTSGRVDDGDAPGRSHLSIGDNSAPWYVQAHPSGDCRSVGVNRGKSKYYDPRCSLKCHQNAAWKESMLLIRFLRSLPAHVRTSFGTLNAFGPVGLADILTIYKAFHKAMSRRFGKSVQYRPFTEVGPRCGRLHLHYAMTSEGVEVTKAAVLDIWRAACAGSGSTTSR